MADDLKDSILENARGPKRAQDDAGSMEQHSLREQIEADQYVTAKNNARRRGFPLKIIKIIPPGAVGSD
jgi:hypothetical protein